MLGKAPGALYGEMEGAQSEFHVGDVKYHLGQSASLQFPDKVRCCGGLIMLSQIGTTVRHAAAAWPAAWSMSRMPWMHCTQACRRRVVLTCQPTG